MKKVLLIIVITVVIAVSGLVGYTAAMLADHRVRQLYGTWQAEDGSIVLCMTQENNTRSVTVVRCNADFLTVEKYPLDLNGCYNYKSAEGRINLFHTPSVDRILTLPGGVKFHRIPISNTYKDDKE